MIRRILEIPIGIEWTYKGVTGNPDSGCECKFVRTDNDDADGMVPIQLITPCRSHHDDTWNTRFVEYTHGEFDPLAEALVERFGACTSQS